MNPENLDSLLASVSDPVEYFRNNDLGWKPYVFQDEYTNWIEEQRAVFESSAVVDQSYHMEILQIDGPEAIELLESLGVNSFRKVREREPPQAMNYIVCNPDGFVIGDSIVFYMEENTFISVGAPWTHNWIRFNEETQGLDTNAELLYDPFGNRNPPDFRFQVQGPNAVDIMEEITVQTLPEIPFFKIEIVEIDGAEVYALGHGMAGTRGFEIFGSYDHHDKILEKILKAGDPHGIRQLGSKAYKTGKIGSGWFNASVPAVYAHDELKEHRKWLGTDTAEAELSIGGSFVSRNIEDYYMTPMERGQGQLVKFDHEFIGRDALKDKINDQRRSRVTLVWDSEDVIDVYSSLFQGGKTKKYIPLPDTAHNWSVAHYDIIRKDGTDIGFSKYPGYLYYKREMLSLATIDVAYDEPGTEVTFVWGEDTEKLGVERHEQTQIKATVAKSPYVQGGRRET